MPGTAGKEKYQCDKCGRTFKTANDLREHEKDCKGPEQIRTPLKG
jgi:transposase-like protein